MLFDSTSFNLSLYLLTFSLIVHNLLWVLLFLVFKLIYLLSDWRCHFIKLLFLDMRLLNSFSKLLDLLLVVLFFTLEIKGCIVLERFLRKLLESIYCFWNLFYVLHESFVHIVCSNSNGLSSNKCDILVEKLFLLFFLESSKFLLLLLGILLILILSWSAIFLLRLKILCLLLKSHLSSAWDYFLGVLLLFTHLKLLSLSWLTSEFSREAWTSLYGLLGWDLLLSKLLLNLSWALLLLRSSRILFLLHVCLIRGCSSLLRTGNWDYTLIHIKFLSSWYFYKSLRWLFLISKHFLDISDDFLLSLFLFNISTCLTLSCGYLGSCCLGWLCQLLLLSSFLFYFVLSNLRKNSLEHLVSWQIIEFLIKVRFYLITLRAVWTLLGSWKATSLLLLLLNNLLGFPLNTISLNFYISDSLFAFDDCC